MKKLLILLGVIFLGGCVIRTYTVDKPRVDIDLEGNRGFLAGEPKEVVKKESRLRSSRRLSVLEIEFGNPLPPREESRVKEQVSYQSIPLEEEEFEPIPRKITAYKVTPRKTTYKEYTVRKKDTLQKISYRFYRTTRKWKLIYEANRNVIKSPNKIYPGLKIRIPVLD